MPSHGKGNWPERRTKTGRLGARLAFFMLCSTFLRSKVSLYGSVQLLGEVVASGANEVVLSSHSGWLFHGMRAGLTNHWKTLLPPQADNLSSPCADRDGAIWYRTADAAVVYTDRGISRGMEFGIATAKAAGKPVEYRSLGTGWKPVAK